MIRVPYCQSQCVCDGRRIRVPYLNLSVDKRANGPVNIKTTVVKVFFCAEKKTDQTPKTCI